MMTSDGSDIRLSSSPGHIVPQIRNVAMQALTETRHVKSKGVLFASPSSLC